MAERLLILGLVALIWGLIYLAYRAYKGWQVAKIAATASHDPLILRLEPGRPAIVLFTADFCGPCKTQQRPILRQLGQKMAGLQILEVDVQAEPEAAQRWGVLTLPTTFILDAQGQAREVNYGVASADKLTKQLVAISG
jgi:thiol-disulfide isomerase/thioredoxin